MKKKGFAFAKYVSGIISLTFENQTLASQNGIILSTNKKSQAEMKRRGITERDLFRRALHMRIQLAPDIRIFKSGKQFFVSWL